MSVLELKTPQEKAALLYACLLIDDLQTRGYLGGGCFTVNTENTYASLKVLIALEDVDEPDRAKVVETAVGLIEGGGGIEPGDREIVKSLLHHIAVVEWPAS